MRLDATCVSALKCRKLIYLCAVLGQNGRIKSTLDAELYDLKKISKTDMYKIPKRRYAFRFPSHL